MSVETIRTREQLLTLRDNWSHVYCEDPEAQYFLSWQWLWHLYERRDEPLQILAYRDSTAGSSFQAFLPLRSHLHLSKRQARFIPQCRAAGNFWADYTGLICAPRHETDAIPELARAVASLTWHRLQLTDWRMSEFRLEMFLDAFASDEFELHFRSRRDNDGATDLSKSPCINLPDSFDAWLSGSLSANSRQRIRRYRRKFHAHPELSCRESTGRQLDNDLDSFEKLWCKRWSDQKGSKVSKLAERYALIIEQAVESNDMRLLVMDHENRPVAMNAFYIDRGKQSLLFLVGVRDSDFDILPSGIILHALTIEWAIDQGLRRYDLLRGNEPYKYSLGAVDEQLQSMIMERVISDTKAQKLDSRHVPDALAQLQRYQRHASLSEMECLYRQLLQSWPDSAPVQKAYSQWTLSKMTSG